MSESIILNQVDIERKIKRIALQILEDNAQTKQIVVLGIKNGGYDLAQQVTQEMNAIEEGKAKVLPLSIDKEEPIGSVNLNKADLENEAVVLVDDVANSGRTLFYALQPLTQIPLHSLRVAVLVDRKHKRFPVQADYVGLSLNTTLQEHIRVTFTNHVPTLAELR